MDFKSKQPAQTLAPSNSSFNFISYYLKYFYLQLSFPKQVINLSKPLQKIKSLQEVTTQLKFF